MISPPLEKWREKNSSAVLSHAPTPLLVCAFPSSSLGQEQADKHIVSLGVLEDQGQYFWG